MTICFMPKDLIELYLLSSNPKRKQYCVANIQNGLDVHDWQYASANRIITVALCKDSVWEYRELFKKIESHCCIPISKADCWTVTLGCKFPYPQICSEVQFFSTFIEADQFCKKSIYFKQRKRAGGLVILSREFDEYGQPLQEYKIEKLFPSK